VRLRDAKIYLLTAGRTGSAAEHFALAMKRTGRATLIGETTAGAGHFGGMLPLNDNFAAFIPVGRTFDPDTGKGWEGDGVTPHVEVPAADALIEALVRSGIARDDAVRLSATVHPAEPMDRRTLGR
jgi:C-terminal processing protease CtpA/Prc